MRGSLDSSSVVDLCRGLAEATSTGVLEFEGTAGLGSITFRDGRVHSASSPAPRARLGDRLVNAALLSQEELDDALRQQAESEDRTKLGALLVEQDLVSRDAIRVFVQEQILDAVFELVGWRDGSYEFRREEADTDDKLPVEIRVDQLLVEASRRQNEWYEIERVIPDLDMIPDFATGGSSADAALEPDEFAVLASVDGERSVRDLAAHLGYSEFEAARIVYGLTMIGVIGIHDSHEPDTEPETAGTTTTTPDVEAVEEREAPVDVGWALEEALAGDDGPEGSEETSQPPVRLHIDEEGRFPADEEEDEQGGEDDEPELEAIEFEITPTAVDDDTDRHEGADELEPPAEPAQEASSAPAAAGRADDEQDFDEPEPWTPDPDDLARFAEEDGLADRDDEEAPETERSKDLDDDEFEKLINQLAGTTETTPPGTDDPESPDQEQAPDEEQGSEPPPSRDAPSREREEPSESGSDVSEFLRELSRLAVDEEDGDNPEPIARPPRRDSGDKSKSQPDRSEPSEDDKDDDKKKRGFFGWGR